MEKNNLVHIKFDREESKDYKREILHSQLNLLKVLRSLKKFKELRLKELDKKIEIHEELKEMKRGLTSLEKTLPIPKIPKILKKEEPKKEEVKNKKKGKGDAKKDSERENKINPDSIEGQLMEIQKKLDEIR